MSTSVSTEAAGAWDALQRVLELGAFLGDDNIGDGDLGREGTAALGGGATWTVRALLASTSGAGWNARAVVVKLPATTWDGRGQAVGTALSASASWDVTHPLSSTAVADWDITAVVTKNAAASWDGFRNSVAAGATATWDVWQRVVEFGSTLGDNTLGDGTLGRDTPTARSAAAGWSALSSSVLVTISARWDDLHVIDAATVSARWDDLSILTTTTSARWDINRTTTFPASAGWDNLHSVLDFPSFGEDEFGAEAFGPPGNNIQLSTQWDQPTVLVHASAVWWGGLTPVLQPAKDFGDGDFGDGAHGPPCDPTASAFWGGRTGIVPVARDFDSGRFGEQDFGGQLEPIATTRWDDFATSIYTARAGWDDLHTAGPVTVRSAWDGRILTFASVTGRWDDLAKVSATAMGAWDGRQNSHVHAYASGGWTDFGPILLTKSAGWDVLLKVSNLVEGQWDDFQGSIYYASTEWDGIARDGLVQNAGKARWGVRAIVATGERAFGFASFGTGTFGPASNGVLSGSAWNDLTLVYAFGRGRWDDLVEITPATVLAGWSNLLRVTKTAITHWRCSPYAGGSWSIKETKRFTPVARWDVWIRMAPPASRTARWDIHSRWGDNPAMVTLVARARRPVTLAQIFQGSFWQPVELPLFSGASNAALSQPADAGEPDLGTDTRSWWYFIRIPGPGQLTARGMGSTTVPDVDVYTGDDLSSLTHITTGVPQSDATGAWEAIDTAVTAGIYYIRLASNTVEPAQLTYLYVAAGRVAKKVRSYWDGGHQASTAIAGVHCDVTVAAAPGTFTLGSTYTLSGITAQVFVRAYPGTFTLRATRTTIAGATAQVNVSANTRPLITGDRYRLGSIWRPVELSGLTGSYAADMGANPIDPADPNYANLTGDKVWWFHIRPQISATLTFTSARVDSSLPLGVEEYRLAGNTYSGQAADVAINGSTTVSTSRILAGADYYIRLVAAPGSGTYSSLIDNINFTLTQNQVPLSLVVDVNQAPSTPWTLHVTVLNADPNEIVDFTWSPPVSSWQLANVARPISLLSTTTDVNGIAGPFPMNIPATTSGTYTITARGRNSGRTGSFVFSALTNPDGTSTGGGSGGGGTGGTTGGGSGGGGGTVGGSGGFAGDLAYIVSGPTPPIYNPGGPPTQVQPNRWQVNDPTPGGLGEYVFPFNPENWTPPHAPRNYTVEHTASVTGQAIIWESGQVATQWKFNGYVETQEFYDKLVAFHALRRRFWLFDHRGRQWVVTFTELDLVPHRNIAKPWAHDYTVSGLIFAEIL